MQGLTDRQQQVLEYIRSSITQRGYPPTLREIGAHMGIRSTNGVNDHLRALERKGYLTREDMKSRALRPCDTESLPASVPANDEEGHGRECRSSAASPRGFPSLPKRTCSTRSVSIERLVRGGREVFGLRVTGDSMIEAGIFSGDYIFVT
jgi:repressor LexA